SLAVRSITSLMKVRADRDCTTSRWRVKNQVAKGCSGQQPWPMTRENCSGSLHTGNRWNPGRLCDQCRQLVCHWFSAWACRQLEPHSASFLPTMWAQIVSRLVERYHFLAASKRVI